MPERGPANTESSIPPETNLPEGPEPRRRRYRLINAITEMTGLMPLLMKQRNGAKWTPQEKRRLHGRLRRLARLSPILILLLLPGSVLLLPVYAWWLDRRRKRRTDPPCIKGNGA